MYDLIVAALQTDSTRVMTYRMPGQALLSSMGFTPSPQRESLLPGRAHASVSGTPIRRMPICSPA